MSKFVSHTRSLFLIDNTKNPQVNGIYSKIWQHLPKSNFNLIWQAIEDDRYPEYSWSLSSPSYNYSSRIPVYWNTSLHSHRGCSDIHCVLKNKKKMEGKPVKYFIPDVWVGNSQEISAGYTKIYQPCSIFSRSNHWFRHMHGKW